MKIKKFENVDIDISPIEMEIYDHLKQKMEEDCGDGGDVLQKMDEFDHSWLVDELIQFISNNIPSSYTLLKFSRKYDYNELKDILKDLFPAEFEKANKIINGKYENVSEESHTIVNFSDTLNRKSKKDEDGTERSIRTGNNNLSAEYHVNNKNGKNPYKKENRLFVEIEEGKSIPKDANYLTPEQANEYNRIQQQIIELEEKQKEIVPVKEINPIPFMPFKK